MKNLSTTLIQATNIVLLLRGLNADTRKFAAWRIDRNDPQEVLSGLQVVNASFEDSIKIFEHPLETGAVITDHMIIEPNQVTIEAIISNDDATTLKELEYLCLNGIPLKIRVENKIIPRALIKGKPFSLSAGMIDKTRFNITFREEQVVEPVYVSMTPSSVRNQANVSRINSGIKQAKPVQKSWLKSAFLGGRT